MCVHDAEHNFRNSIFKVIGYVKYEFKFFLVLKFLTGRWSVGRWPVHLVGGRLVGGFKETQSKQCYHNDICRWKSDSFSSEFLE